MQLLAQDLRRPDRQLHTPYCHAQSESARPNKSWGQAVATLGRPHCQEVFGSATVRKNLDSVAPQCRYGLASQNNWTCGFTLSVGMQCAIRVRAQGTVCAHGSPPPRPQASVWRPRCWLGSACRRLRQFSCLKSRPQRGATVLRTHMYPAPDPEDTRDIRTGKRSWYNCGLSRIHNHGFEKPPQ